MRQKLVNFSDFANSLYVHEAEYLCSIQKFEKEENIRILNLILYNCKNPLNTLPYDVTIDKRTYSYIKNWITQSLQKIDVDVFYEWLISIEKQVLTDSIEPENEKLILDKIEIIKPSHYYFIRFFELILHYRDYLIVRNRKKFYYPVSQYINQHNQIYGERGALNARLNTVTEHIMQQDKSFTLDYLQMEEFLKLLYFDTEIDGYTRYRAVIRLTLLYYNTRDFSKLQNIYDHLDNAFRSESFYSKRILANYYANRAMMHSKLNELVMAQKYAYLSIRQKNNDYLFYLVNLIGVLLKSQKNKEALSLMNQSINELKNTNSFYNKIGFVVFYMKSLKANNLISNAINYGSNYFEAYKKDIFQHRWHLFMSTYIQLLLSDEQYQRIISLSKRYGLINKEKQIIGKAGYLPVIYWHTLVAEYMECIISIEKLEENMLKSALEEISHSYKSQKIKELLANLSEYIPSVIKNINQKIKNA